MYATFLALLTWQWYTVRRQDRRDRPEFLAVTGRYVTGMGVAVVVIVASAFLPAGPRLLVWAGSPSRGSWASCWWGARGVGMTSGLPPTDSLVERFGLFTIIVLGEFVFGVVDGLSAAERDVKTITTGMIALVIGFGFWWIYFDLVGRRLPRSDRGALANWLLSHLPITLSIAAGGAAMVSLIDHADDASTPASTAWLLAGAVALGLLALILTERALVDAERLEVVYRPLAWRWPGERPPPSSSAGTPGAMAPCAAARGDPHGALALRRQPIPTRRRLGRQRVLTGSATARMAA